MNAKLLWLSLLALALALTSVAGLYTWNKAHKPYAYIELGKVLDEFDLAKQYRKKLENVVMARKTILDSLELNLNSEAKTIKSGKNSSKEFMDQFLFDKEYYVEKRKQFEEDNNATQKQYNEEVIKQLNQYVKDYGEKEKYDFIYGAEGSGVIMYAHPGFNISEPIIKYINERYKGLPK